MFNGYKMLKQNPYFVTDKLAVIASIKHGESQAKVSHDNCVPESTIRGVIERLYMIF